MMHVTNENIISVTLGKAMSSVLKKISFLSLANFWYTLKLLYWHLVGQPRIA